MTNYFSSFPNSFSSKTFIAGNIPGVTDGIRGDINLSGFDFNKAANLKFNPIAFDSNSNLTKNSQGWTFITAPEDISWDVNNEAQRIDIFGTNSPPVVSGTHGMRDLTLGNALVEGFVRNVTVEGKIKSLEKLLDYGLNTSDGYVSVPVYQVWANRKAYGNGYYIIKDVKVRETMRDLRGDATRAYVDVSFMEVPAYQVNTGRDLASKPAAEAKALALPDLKKLREERQAAAAEAAQKTAPQKAATSGANQRVGTPSKPSSGAGSASPSRPAAAPAAAAPAPQTIRGRDPRTNAPIIQR